jgi:hypothetical protein
MQTKIVSFRLPIKEYANLLSIAADKNLALSDYVLTLIFGDKKNTVTNYKVEYKTLVSNLIKAIDSNKNISFIETQYGKGSRIIVCEDPLIQHLRLELKRLS